MNDITIFEHEKFGKMRTVKIDGEPWAVGKDVAEALGYANTNDAIVKHVDADDKRGSQIATPSCGGVQTMTVINESGLYSLIFASKLPAAKEFKRWVTSEVLPSIRKTGKYSVGDGEELTVKERLAIGQALEKLARLTRVGNNREILIMRAANTIVGQEILDFDADAKPDEGAAQVAAIFLKWVEVNDEHFSRKDRLAVAPEYGFVRNGYRYILNFTPLKKMAKDVHITFQKFLQILADDGAIYTGMPGDAKRRIRAHVRYKGSKVPTIRVAMNEEEQADGENAD